MAKRGNKERILEASIELFNRSGTVAVTTNHIAKHLKISPGNLYFHFADKEEIIRELFLRHCADTYAAWDPRLGADPQSFLERAFDVFWKYRFFHREMYHLRRQDRRLSHAWKRHMKACYGLLNKNYRNWVEAGKMGEIFDPSELRNLSDTLLLASSAYLGFFESPEKPATQKSVKAGIDHVNQLLAPYIAR